MHPLFWTRLPLLKASLQSLAKQVEGGNWLHPGRLIVFQPATQGAPAFQDPLPWFLKKKLSVKFDTTPFK